MKQVVRSRQAQTDLMDIWAFIAESNETAADRMLDELDERGQRLVRFPEIGPLREDIGPGVRSLRVGSYLILYNVQPDRVEIVRYIHGLRDLRDLLK